MKKQFLLFCFLIVAIAGYSQADSVSAPYLRSPFFPEVKLLLPDKVSYFSQADLPATTASLMMVFDPACEHCQQETKDIIKHIDQLKDIVIVMATPMPFDSMMKFRSTYDLSKYSNIIIANDEKFFLPEFYQLGPIPFFALYDKKKKLIKVFRGPTNIEDVIKGFK